MTTLLSLSRFYLSYPELELLIVDFLRRNGLQVFSCAIWGARRGDGILFLPPRESDAPPYAVSESDFFRILEPREDAHFGYRDRIDEIILKMMQVRSPTNITEVNFARSYGGYRVLIGKQSRVALGYGRRKRAKKFAA